MKRILITGGDGYLGRALVAELKTRNQIIRIMSRKIRPDTLPEDIEWQQADVVSGDGLELILDGVDVIVNCLSNPLADTYATDILGTQQLLSIAKSKEVKHILHISIIGIDRIIYPYYQYKLGAELAVIESGIPYTISRIAQFHYFVDYIVSALRDVTADIVNIPTDVQFQPISPTDVASHLAPYIIGDEARGRLPDFGGPEVLHLKDIVSEWLVAQNMTQAIQPVTESENNIPFLNMFGDGFVNGYNTNPDGAVGTITWAKYLEQTYS